MSPDFTGLSCLRRGTALVPTNTSDPSRSSTSADASGDLDADGRIDALNLSAGGRKVAGSNPAAPTKTPAKAGVFCYRSGSRFPRGVHFCSWLVHQARESRHESPESRLPATFGSL
jgi:hypothetical protein